MKRIFSHPLTALGAGLCLRLFFVFRFPANSGDTILYEQMATNWLNHGVYAMLVGGQITPVDLRMPGYPAFLALVYAITRRTGPPAHLAVMLAQVVIDLLTCLAIALLASRLCPRDGARRFVLALWLAATCPFTANYTAVPLTETFATFFTIASTLCLVHLIHRRSGPDAILQYNDFVKSRRFYSVAAFAGFLAGLGALFRPETPLLLIAAFPVILWALWSLGQWKRGVWAAAISALACLLPLVPWAVRNAATLHEFQFLASKNSNLPGELVPYGFMAWEKTWLYRAADCYLVPWKLNEEPLDVNHIPARAFDSPEEKDRVAAILEPYNLDLTLTPEEDAAFAQLARERTARHPLRTYFLLPVARAFAIWFTPRIELLPVSGHVFPLLEAWQDDRLDQSVTLGFFFLNLFYVALAAWGAWRLWRSSRAAHSALALLLVFVLLRTAFLTTLETPEPRYVLECFPAILALAAQALAHRRPTDPHPDPSFRTKSAK